MPINTHRTYNVQGIKALGGFRNERKVFDWEGLLLELDATHYEWGTLYEVEVETVGGVYVCVVNTVFDMNNVQRTFNVL